MVCYPVLRIFGEPLLGVNRLPLDKTWKFYLSPNEGKKVKGPCCLLVLMIAQCILNLIVVALKGYF